MTQGFFGEEVDDTDPSLYFNSQAVFRPDKEILTPASPSKQLTGFGTTSIYGQTSANLSSNLVMSQRSMSNAPFQRNATPTSIATAPSFQMGPQQPSQQASPNRNVFSFSQQRGLFGQFPNQSVVSSGQMKRPNAMSSALMSSVGSNPLGMSAFSRLPGGDASQGNLDPADFPILGNRTAMPNPLPAGRNYVGMVSKPVSEPAPEFHIQQEDFPALPGAQSVADTPMSTSADSSNKSSSWLSEVYNGCLQPSSTAYDQALKDSVNIKPDGMRKQGIHTHPDGTISNIPPGMVGDQFGMVGLLTFIRAAETDPNLVALAPGIDLTTLGLNLNSPENLYSTFQSPWADAPCRPQDIDFHVPTEYLTNIYIRDKLAPIKLNRYGEDLLFFLFYMNGGDVLQLASATELYDRDWRYHKEEHVWITRVPSVEASVKTNTFERGTYYFFDAQNWVKVPKDFHLEYDKLEERPHLPQMPPTLHHAGTTGAGTAPTGQPTPVMSH
ncbi:hypothetical protein NP493_419g05027 [Ridgeia piscesae]|uniref:CCR4-NOT transcription complex subunit 2 n=1 Tax=Ridgeia piscesae TaxID=27915 RepID=A0AAD9NUB3_RIDPI|nr:hypothetical protein NP493_419g05027 [Ridgeia piscesae]